METKQLPTPFKNFDSALRACEGHSKIVKGINEDEYYGTSEQVIDSDGRYDYRVIGRYGRSVWASELSEDDRALLMTCRG